MGVQLAVKHFVTPRLGLFVEWVPCFEYNAPTTSVTPPTKNLGPKGSTAGGGQFCYHLQYSRPVERRRELTPTGATYSSSSTCMFS